MLIMGLVNCWLSKEHKPLLRRLVKRAKLALEPLSERTMRQIAAFPFFHPGEEYDIAKLVGDACCVRPYLCSHHRIQSAERREP